LPAVQPDADQVIESEFIGKRIQSAIQKLPLHFRTVTILRDIQELSYEEISKILEIPVGTIKSRINRGRIQLAEKLKHFKE
jgi:RNA polymerase sigma-70 factor (ECF subfamily)